MHDCHRLVPDDFEVPAVLEHPRFRQRMLTVNDFVKDYDAVVRRDIAATSAGAVLSASACARPWQGARFRTNSP